MENREKSGAQAAEKTVMRTNRICRMWLRIRCLSIDYLETKGTYRSVNLAKFYLVLFCVASTIVMIWSISKSFDKAPAAKPISRVSVARAREKPAYHRMDTDLMRVRLEKARHYLDSLKADPKGRGVYNAILKSRPGLLDSLQMAEHYYHE